MPEKIVKKFEKKHLENIMRYQKRVRNAYLKAIEKIFQKAINIKLRSETFNINQHPVLKNRIDEVLLEFQKELEITLANGIKGEWELSTEKNAEIITKSLAGKQISDAVNKLIYDPHEGALNQFIKSRDAGLGLSDRVWKYTNQFRTEIEQGLYVGVSEGKPALQMARDQRQYLQEPDRLFRRVKDAKGKLVLSQAARSYNPGRGIYRSSIKNAFRLTRTVTNDSYRMADIVRYQSIPFVLGYEVKLSANHPTFDICDMLKGTYGKDFVWKKWHPQCMCYTVPKLPSTDQYDQYEDAILNGTSDKVRFSGEVSGVPAQFKAFINDNPERMANWKRKPDWVTENKKFTSDLK